MSIKTLFYCFYDYINDYNLFMIEEDINDDNEENIGENQQSSNDIKEQKYSTWLYIFLLMSKTKYTNVNC